MPRIWKAGCVVGLLLVWVGCGAPATPGNPSSATLTTNTPDVSVSADGVNFTSVAAGASRIIALGDRLRTSDPGEGDLLLSCARVRIFGGSDLHLEEIHATGANLSFSGSQLYSSACGDQIQLTTNPPPPEGIVQSTGTVFLTAYSQKNRIVFLWTVHGEALLSNAKGTGPMRVPAGMWSVVRAGASPEAPRPVSSMGDTINELNLRGVYDRVVSQLQSQGYGPGAPGPLAVATIVSDTPIPTPARTPCPVLRTPELSVNANQFVVWKTSGGCAPFKGTLTARYQDQNVPYATYAVSEPSGGIADKPPPRCEGKFTIIYTLTLSDSTGQTTQASTTTTINIVC